MAFLATLEGAGATALLGFRSIRLAWRRGIAWRESLRQMEALCVRSAPLVVLGMIFFGAVMVIVAHDQASRLTGNLALIGPPYFELMIRELGPLIAALLTAARTGASTAAELGAMSVNEQIEALEMSAGDPLTDLVVPRLIATTLGVPLLCALGIVAGSLSASATAHIAYAVDVRAFLDPRYVDGFDVASAAIKAFACGVVIPLAAARHGLKAQLGVAAVGQATTEGVVAASLACLIVDFGVSSTFFLLGL